MHVKEKADLQSGFLDQADQKLKTSSNISYKHSWSDAATQLK